MPRKKKAAKKKETNTYYKAKNGRFYKKVEIDGKTRVRFVSNAEATGALKPAVKKRQYRRKKTKVPEVTEEKAEEPEES